MRKRLAVYATIAFAVVIPGFWLTHWLLSPFPGVTRENCARLRPGMTVQQVEAILGGPAGDRLWWVDEQGKLDGGDGHWYLSRQKPSLGSIRVRFDARKRVVRTTPCSWLGR